MNNPVKVIETYIKSELLQESSGHDWYHLDRVRLLAIHIAIKEGAEDLELIELVALLHDVPDIKLNSSKAAGQAKLVNILQNLSLPKERQMVVIEIIHSISYNGGHEQPLHRIEAKIVRDADRLDAMGATGIARTFAYGGHVGNSIYDPELAVRENMSIEEYRYGKNSTIHHFYEKLLKLKDLMCTETGKRIASERHAFMEQFLERFYQEWKGLI